MCRQKHLCQVAFDCGNPTSSLSNGTLFIGTEMRPHTDSCEVPETKKMLIVVQGLFSSIRLKTFCFEGLTDEAQRTPPWEPLGVTGLSILILSTSILLMC